ncbi:MAG: glutathione S-transferase [Verrucomicrobiaceae bacterium]|nr:glutathione S-transferase [Verrucomicrobiaceae bacterium]
MSDLTLFIGNKNYSSWSLRPWLLLREADIAFNEVRFSLYQQDSKAQISAHSPSGRVPALRDDAAIRGGLTVWDSLAICEYIAEQFPIKELWPHAIDARAVARSVSAEIHSGFSALRNAMSMNCRERFPGKGQTPEVLTDIARITAIWHDCRARYGNGGGFLFGKFTIADAMYAPVVLRFQTYAVELDEVAQAYSNAILSLPSLKEWIAAGVAESETLPQFEPYKSPT